MNRRRQSADVAVPSVGEIWERLRALADAEQAVLLQRFFKTGPGEYGEGDIFYGIKMPHLRALARTCRAAPPEVAGALLDAPVHEARMLGVILLTEAHKRAAAGEEEVWHRSYLGPFHGVNNWDLVDVSAPRMLGVHLRHRPRGLLRRWVRSANLWERRAAIVATWAYSREGECEETLTLARALLGDPHDLIHKAVGWMLREAEKRQPAAVRDFLRQHAAAMPRTMLRYTIERFPEQERLRWLRG